jgi:membrane-bound lytic murein transglycosylase D
MEIVNQPKNFSQKHKTMNPNLKNIFLTAMVLLCSIYERTVSCCFRYFGKQCEEYKSIINANREIVDFIEYSLVQKGLPRHLRNLALIESHFNRNIASGAGAVGVWQFMTAHANQYGLTEQNRTDLYKSTKTAVSLANLYKKYNNWITVVAAYNCGEGNIAKACGSKLYSIPCFL